MKKNNTPSLVSLKENYGNETQSFLISELENNYLMTPFLFTIFINGHWSNEPTRTFFTTTTNIF